MVTVPAIVLGLVFLAGAAAFWLYGALRLILAIRRMSRTELTQVLAALEVVEEAQRREDDDDDDQGGGILQPVHAG